MSAKILALLAIVIAAGILRLYKIDQVPASLFYDEVDYGYQARSLIETGKDYRGSFSPFYVHSFNDVRAPVPAYFTILSTLAFKTPELQVRAPAAVLGAAVVVLIFLLVKIWTKSWGAGLISAVVFAANPWQIQFGRVLHEVGPMLALYLFALWLFYLSLKGSNGRRFYYLLAAVVVFALDVYTYRTMSLFIPLTFIALFLIYHRELLTFGVRKLAALAFVSAAIVVPFLYATTLGAPDQPRINQLSLTADERVPVSIQRAREVDSGDLEDPTLGKNPSLLSFFFHNKPQSWLTVFADNFYQSFSTEFLFLKGDPNLRHSIGQVGVLYLVDVLPLFAGLLFLTRNLKVKEYRWLFVWLLLSPIPAALTIDGARHGTRLFIFSAPLLLTVGLGWWRVLQALKKYSYGKVFLGSLLILWLGLFVFYLHRYFVHYPIESARYFGYGFKQAAAVIGREDAAYKKVVMAPTNDPPMIYYLFWSNTPPKKLQEYGTNFSKETILGKSLDKYKVVDFVQEGRVGEKLTGNLDEDTLYLLTGNELKADLRKSGSIPLGVRLLESVLYPDKESAFYLIAKKNPL